MKTSEIVIDVVRSLFRFGKISSTKSDSAKSIVAKVSADAGDNGPSDNEIWGHAPLSYKPADSTECFFYQLGDERIVLATADRQFQISIGNGEVVVRALGAANAAYVHLKPNGDALIKGANVTVDMSGETKIGLAAAQFVALANLVTANMNTLKSAITATVVVANDGGASFKSTLLTALASWPDNNAATKTKAL